MGGGPTTSPYSFGDCRCGLASPGRAKARPHVAGMPSFGVYESIRKLGAAEREATSLFVPVRHLWLMGLHAQGIDVFGYSLMQDTYFDRHLKFLRGWIERYKLR